MRSRAGLLLALLLGVVLVAGAGLLVAENQAHRDRTFRIGSDSYPCSEHDNTAFVLVNVFGTRTASFSVDGDPVAGAYSPPGLEPYAGIAATPPRWRCDDGREHRYDVVTDRPEGCRIIAIRVYDNTERPGPGETYETTGTCSVTIVD